MPTTEIEQYVIDVVRAKRKEAKLSQAALAHLLDVSEGYIGNIESTKYQDTYNLNHINKLAKIFKCSPQDFIPKSAL